MKIGDKIGWKTEWTIYKWDKDGDDEIAKFLQNGGKIEEALKVFAAQPIIECLEGNAALNEGLAELIDIICGLGTPTKWDNTNARLGVGDSSTPADAAQTGLQAATNKTWKAMDTGYPQRSGQTAEWRATFGSGDANYAWNEFTVVNSADDAGKNLNRKVESKGTKASGEIPYVV
jgi:uncharacterized cupin superfamily protein